MKILKESEAGKLVGVMLAEGRVFKLEEIGDKIAYDEIPQLGISLILEVGQVLKNSPDNYSDAEIKSMQKFYNKTVSLLAKVLISMSGLDDKKFQD